MGSVFSVSIKLMFTVGVMCFFTSFLMLLGIVPRKSKCFQCRRKSFVVLCAIKGYNTKYTKGPLVLNCHAPRIQTRVQSALMIYDSDYRFSSFLLLKVVKCLQWVQWFFTSFLIQKASRKPFHANRTLSICMKKFCGAIIIKGYNGKGPLLARGQTNVVIRH